MAEYVVLHSQRTTLPPFGDRWIRVLLAQKLLIFSVHYAYMCCRCFCCCCCWVHLLAAEVIRQWWLVYAWAHMATSWAGPRVQAIDSNQTHDGWCQIGHLGDFERIARHSGSGGVDCLCTNLLRGSDVKWTVSVRELKNMLFYFRK